ncbi:MAG: hypothetical protein IJD04_01525 [Desulfovibrionaceae bacterium]|nr:hypothetical protein [Desulfovibrionaceae bacterium]
MSSSNPESSSNWGTIFMGPEPMRETTLARIEGSNSGPQWNDETEAEYLARVRERATQKAAEILREAQAEAVSLREQARQEGYQQGLNEAQAELEEFRIASGQTTAAVLSAIEAQADRLTAAWEQELCALVRAAVEAGIGHELSRHRAELLQALFLEAAAGLSKGKSAIVFTSQEDAPVVADIVANAGGDYPSRFQVRGDPGVSPGGIVLESSLGLVENRLEMRRALVENILNELVLCGQEAAFVSTSQPVEAGMPGRTVSVQTAQAQSASGLQTTVGGYGEAAPAATVPAQAEGAPGMGNIDKMSGMPSAASDGHDFDAAAPASEIIPEQPEMTAQPDMADLVQDISADETVSVTEPDSSDLEMMAEQTENFKAENLSEPAPELGSLIPGELLRGKKSSGRAGKAAAPENAAPDMLAEEV